jgi:hypothetical protein
VSPRNSYSLTTKIDEYLTMKNTIDLEEFKSLVDGLKGDCDKCKMDCRHRLQWLDSVIRMLNELAERLERLEMRFAQVLVQYQAHCRICARLNILCSPICTKDQEPHDDQEEDIEKKLTDWN